MGLISPDVRDFLHNQKLGYVATVSVDNLPNLSPKGTIFGLDDHTLVFADIRSPDTMKNIKHNPSVEINVIDPLLRKGYLFRGEAKILKEGKQYDDILNHYRLSGVKSPIKGIVLVDITSMDDVISPLYDLGLTENEIKSRWQKHFQQL